MPSVRRSSARADGGASGKPGAGGTNRRAARRPSGREATGCKAASKRQAASSAPRASETASRSSADRPARRSNSAGCCTSRRAGSAPDGSSRGPVG